MRPDGLRTKTSKNVTSNKQSQKETESKNYFDKDVNWHRITYFLIGAVFTPLFGLPALFFLCGMFLHPSTGKFAVSVILLGFSILTGLALRGAFRDPPRWIVLPSSPEEHRRRVLAMLQQRRDSELALAHAWREEPRREDLGDSKGPKATYDARDSIPMDIGIANSADIKPVQKFVHLVLRQAIADKADKIEFRLVRETPPPDPLLIADLILANPGDIHTTNDGGFQISYRVRDNEYQMAPAPSNIFSPCMVVLCNHAGIPYYATAMVTGTIRTKNPATQWTLESDNLRKRVILSKTESLAR